MGTALASSKSQIALRMISAAEVTESELPSLIASRLEAALEYRRLLKVPNQSNAYRMVFSEADQLPGLIIDRYNDVLAFQVLTQAMDRPELRAAVISVLQDEFDPSGIIERVEARIRELEDLTEVPGGRVYVSKPATMIEQRRNVQQYPLHY